MLTAEQRQSRARLANTAARARRSGTNPSHDPAVLEARREFRYVSAEEYVRRLVSEAPPLTAAQRGRLALLLRGGGARDGGAV